MNVYKKNAKRLIVMMIMIEKRGKED